jgi:hypothetical protein
MISKPGEFNFHGVQVAVIINYMEGACLRKNAPPLTGLTCRRPLPQTPSSSTSW